MKFLSEIFWIDGRCGRLRWWLTGLLQGAVFLFVLFAFQPDTGLKGLMERALSSPPLMALFAVLMWTGFVVNIRRWHDRDKSGWWLLIGALPLVGPGWQLLELGFLAGTPGDNRYGPPPGGGADISADVAEMRVQRPTGGLAKVDDDYIAAYAKRYKAEQAAASAVQAAPVFTSADSGGSFGKRR